MSDIAVFDKDKQYLLLSLEFYKEIKEKLDNTFNFYSIISKKDKILISFNKNLPSKKEVGIILKGSEKNELSCYFCSHRIECTTGTNSWCKNFNPNPKYSVEITDILSFFNNYNLPIIFGTAVKI